MAVLMRIFLQGVEDGHGALTALDQAAGDGDYGDNLRDGLRGAVAAIPEGSTLEQEFRIASEYFLDNVGGTSGPLLGLLFQAVAAGLADAGTEDEGIVAGLARGLAAIQRVGEARVGDRTMIDCLAPTLDEIPLAGPLDWAKIANGSLGHARATASIPARMGRASYLGQRAVGTPDPGAIGIAILFWALAVRHDLSCRDQLTPPAAMAT